MTPSILQSDVIISIVKNWDWLISRKREWVNWSIFSVRLADKKRTVMKAIVSLERLCALSERLAIVLTCTLVSQSKDIFKNLDSTIQSILIFVDLMSWYTLEQGTSLNSRPSLDFLMKGIACFYSMYTTSYFWLYMYIVVWSLKSTDWPLQLSLEESNIYIAGSNSHVGSTKYVSGCNFLYLWCIWFCGIL